MVKYSSVNLSHEELLLLKFSKQDLLESEIKEISKIPSYDIDWDELWQLVLQHKIAPMFIHHIDRIKNEGVFNFAPKHIYTKALITNRLNSIRNKDLFNELSKLNKQFQMQKIKFTVLKGPAMAWQIYRDPGNRLFSDLDLLVESHDVKMAHQILINEGYVTQGLGDVDHLSKMESHLFLYTKSTNKMTFDIELHHPHINYIVDLKKILDKAEYYYDGIGMPNIVDLFIYSCIHAWEHYPSNMHRLAVGGTRMLLYTDILESYKVVESKNLLSHAYNRAIELECLEIVSNMIFLTEKMLGKFCGYRDFLSGKTNYGHNWESKHVTSLIENKLLRPLEEYKRLNELYLLKKTDGQIQNYVGCKFVDFDNTKLDITYLKQNEKLLHKENNAQRDDKFFGDSPIAYTSHMEEKAIQGSFDFMWDKENFYVVISTSYDLFLPLCNEEHFDSCKSSITLSFGSNESCVPKHFYVQLKQNDRHHIYVKKDKNDDFNIETTKQPNLYKLKDSKIDTSINNGLITLIIALQWTQVGLVPERGVEFLFNFSIKQVNKSKRIIISWISGKGNQLDKCIPYTTVIME